MVIGDGSLYDKRITLKPRPCSALDFYVNMEEREGVYKSLSGTLNKATAEALRDALIKMYPLSSPGSIHVKPGSGPKLRDALIEAYQPVDDSLKWEDIKGQWRSARLKVPGGYLYKIANEKPIFIADTPHG